MNDAFYDSLRGKYDVRYEGEFGKLLAQSQAQVSAPATPAAKP